MSFGGSTWRLFSSAFLLVVLLLHMAPECEKAVMCLMENIYVSDNLPSGRSHGAVRHGFNGDNKVNKVSLSRNTEHKAMY